MTDRDFTWRLATPADAEGRGLEETLVCREHTALRYGSASFAFTTEVVARSETGCMATIRFALRETGGAAGGAGGGWGGGEGLAAGFELEAVVRPRIQVRTIDRLGPLEMPALRQAARRLLREAAEQLARRG